MKVLHIVAGSLNGGAAGAFRFIKGLRELGVNSILLNSGAPSSQVEASFTITNTPLKIWLRLQRRIGLLPLFFYRNRLWRDFDTGIGGVDITVLPEYHSSDILHLHYINGIVLFIFFVRLRNQLYGQSETCGHSLVVVITQWVARNMKLIAANVHNYK